MIDFLNENTALIALCLGSFNFGFTVCYVLNNKDNKLSNAQDFTKGGVVKGKDLIIKGRVPKMDNPPPPPKSKLMRECRNTTLI